MPRRCIDVSKINNHISSRLSHNLITLIRLLERTSSEGQTSRFGGPQVSLRRARRRASEGHMFRFGRPQVSLRKTRRLTSEDHTSRFGGLYISLRRDIRPISKYLLNEGDNVRTLSRINDSWNFLFDPYSTSDYIDHYNQDNFYYVYIYISEPLSYVTIFPFFIFFL